MKKSEDFKRYLENKNCFKLICGAGNQNYEEITKLCALYAKAGCRFFDLNASVEAIKAAKKGIKSAGMEDECFICVSIGTKNDPHLSKFKINSAKCISCGNCESVCIQKAINKKASSYIIDENKCIGCAKCLSDCQNSAIERYSKEVLFSEILPQIIEEGVDCIEYHIITEDEDEVMSGWKIITEYYQGFLSVCLDRSKIGDEYIKQRLQKLKNTCDNPFMVQADGAPMSGGSDDFRTTLQAVAMADIVEKSKITPYIFVSGGTNSKTAEMIKLNNIDTTGIAVGSFARKIVKEYVEREDFLENKAVFAEALKIAHGLIEKCVL